MSDINNRISKCSKYILPAVLIIVLVLYVRVCFFQLIFFDDDAIILRDYNRIDKIEKIIPAFGNNYLDGHYYRPLTSISFILDAFVSGQIPWSYHITNILIHAAVVTLLYYLLITMGYPKVAAGPAVILFAISPLQLNSVAWIAGRADLLVCFFSLSSFLLFLKFRISLKLLRIPLIAFLLICAFFSKESALIIPFLIIFYLFLERKIPGRTGANFLFTAVLLALIVLYFQWRVMLIEKIAIEKIVLSNIAVTFRIIPETIAKFFVPFGIKALPDFTPVLSSAGAFMASILFIIPFLLKKINRKRYYFGFLWFLVLMMPGLLFRTNPLDKFYYWDCRSYLPAVGLVIMVSELLSVIIKEHVRFCDFGFISLYFMILFCGSVYYMGYYKNALSFWGSVKSDYPERYLPHVGLYKYYTHTGQKAEAEFHIIKAIDLCPGNVVNREYLFDYYVYKNEPNKAFLVASEGLKLNANELPLIRDLINSAILLNKVELLDPYIFGTSRSTEQKQQLKKVLREETSSLKGFVTGTIYSALITRIGKLESIIQSDSTTMPETAR